MGATITQFGIIASFFGSIVPTTWIIISHIASVVNTFFKNFCRNGKTVSSAAAQVFYAAARMLTKSTD